MKNYGVQQSTVKPLDVEITATKVFVAQDIQPVTEDHGKETFEGFSFTLIEYDKDEYIKLLQQQNEELATEVTNTQMALCDVYELIGG